LGLSDKTIYEIQKIIKNEKFKLEKIDKELRFLIKEDKLKEKVRNKKLVMQCYIRNYRKYKFKIEDLALKHFEDLFYNNFGVKQEHVSLFAIQENFIKILLRPNFVMLDNILGDKIFEKNVLLELDKFFFSYVTIENLKLLMQYFQKLKISAVNVWGYYNVTELLEKYNNKIIDYEIDKIMEGKLKIEGLFFYISRMVKYLMILFVKEKLNEFKLCLYNDESVYLSWLIMEYIFGEETISILYLYFQNYNKMNVVDQVEFTISRNERFDNQLKVFL
jgi:hypothetical protein